MPALGLRAFDVGIVAHGGDDLFEVNCEGLIENEVMRDDDDVID